jgi:hypothetical protein
MDWHNLLSGAILRAGATDHHAATPFLALVHHPSERKAALMKEYRESLDDTTFGAAATCPKFGSPS